MATTSRPQDVHFVQLMTYMSGLGLYAVFLGASYSWSKTHGAYSDVSSHEIAAGNGYTTGGVQIANLAVIDQTGANDRAAINGDDIVFSGDVSWQHVAIRQGGASANAADIIHFVISWDNVTTGGALTWDANGIARVKRA